MPHGDRGLEIRPEITAISQTEIIAERIFELLYLRVESDASRAGCYKGGDG